jgi:hypothetical protein
MSFDPNQETLEEYLRRIHLNDNINKECNNAETKEEKIVELGRARKAIKRKRLHISTN